MMAAIKSMSIVAPPGPVVGSIDFDRVGDSRIATVENSPNIAAGEFTLEAWIKPESVVSFNAILGVGGWQAGQATLYLRTSGDLTVYALGGNSYFNADVPLSEWSHVAMCRYQLGGGTGVIQVFVNGVSVGSAFSANYGTDLNAGQLIMGSDRPDLHQSGFDGKIALARWSDVRRYTANFTPENDYGVDANTFALIGSNDGSTIDEDTGSYTVNTYGSVLPAPDTDGPV